jgi:DNA-binding NarL/FixJ family response regulator
MGPSGVMTGASTHSDEGLSTNAGWDYACPMTVSVALADDNLIVREGIAQLLAGQADIEVVASCDDLDSLLEAIEERNPDVVLTDIRMPPTHSDEGIRLAALLRSRHPEVGVVVLSNYAEPGFAMALLESGSEGRAYLLKERVHSRTQLASAIHSVAAGGSVMDPKIVEPLVSAKSRSERSPLTDLTTREREVLSEIAQGKSNAAIAESLVLTKRAVEKHINSIFLKLNLSDIEDVSKRVKAALLFLADAEVPRV